jgi:hypothetical protein
MKTKHSRQPTAKNPRTKANAGSDYASTHPLTKIKINQKNKKVK